MQKAYTQDITYRLASYEDVLNKTNLLKSVEGEAVSVKVDIDRFNDKKAPARHYTLVARLPVGNAIRFC